MNPIRHAPYEDGPADFAIGLKPIPLEAWLEGGEADPAARKDPLFETRREDVFAELPGSRAGQAEVLRLVEGVVGAAPRIPGLPDLQSAARLVPDDLCLMEDRDGDWRLTAISLSAGTFFTAREAIGLGLAELHGPVPDFSGRFLTRVRRVFHGLRPGLILERRNWTLAATGDLFVPDPAPHRAEIPGIAPKDAAWKLFIRVERQTLRRLPETGGALFTIRVWRYPLADLRADPARLNAFARAWREAPAAFRAYKNLPLYDGLVEAFLRAMGE